MRAENFWGHVQKAESGCWLWTGARTSAGYGNLRIDGTNDYAHRVSYRLAVGPIPDGEVLDHLCRVRHCVRPDHLEPVAHAENVRRGAGTYGPLRTACIHGHDMTDPTNVYVTPSGQRRCRTCARALGSQPERMADSRERSRRQGMAVARASRHLGLTKREYARLHGWSERTALRILGEVS